MFVQKKKKVLHKQFPGLKWFFKTKPLKSQYPL